MKMKKKYTNKKVEQNCQKVHLLKQRKWKNGARGKSIRNIYKPKYRKKYHKNRKA